MDRLSIALAYWAYMALWNEGGVTNRDRQKNKTLPNGQMDTISGQLNRMGFDPPRDFSVDEKTWKDPMMEAVYWHLVAKYELKEMLEGDPFARISPNSFVVEAPLSIQ